MEGHFLWDLTGTGFWVLLVIGGFLALVIPGRFIPLEAERVGLGRHVEAILIVSLIITLALGTNTHVPVFVGPGGVLAVSLLGAVVPTILAIFFLVAAGWRRLVLSAVPLIVVSLAAFLTSEPVANLGIIARPPYYFIPALLAALGGWLVAWRSLHAIPLAYAYGSLGALIGADFLRLPWILGTPLTAASIGGADALDLVFLMGLWAAAIAVLPFAPRLVRLDRRNHGWENVARLANQRDAEAALVHAERLVHERLQRWARARGLAGEDPQTLVHISAAAPTLNRLRALRDAPRPWDIKEVQRVLEDLAGLEERLRAPELRDVAESGDRFMAGLIDLVPVILAGVLAVVMAFSLELQPAPGESPQALMSRHLIAGITLVLWTMIATHVLYPFFAEWLSNGRTIGKAIMKLQVRSRDGARPSGWAYFVRNLVRLVDMLLLYLLPFVSGREAGRERLGDHFAQTYVAATRTKSIHADTPSETAMPESAIQWSQETARLPR